MQEKSAPGCTHRVSFRGIPELRQTLKGVVPAVITGTAEVDSTTCQNAQYTCKTGVPYKVLTTLWICFLVLYMLIVQVALSEASMLGQPVVAFHLACVPTAGS